MSPPAGYPEDRPPTAAERRALWNDRYANEGWVFGLEPNQFVAEFFSDRPPGRTLDLGCGQGRNAVWLARQGHTVTGVDLSSVAIDQARGFADAAGVEVSFETADLTEWRGDAGSYDYVVLSYLQIAEDDRRRIHQTAREVVAPGGMVFVIAHHLDNLEHGVGGPQLRGVLFTERDLESDFAGFEILQARPVERLVEMESGPATAVDVLFVARKPA